jgi:DNA-binding NarL/FixJ family response regulator
MFFVSIIIVDDQPILIKGLASLIKTYPYYQVAGWAANSADALELVREKKPNLAIVDLSLGGEDGLDLIKAMKVLDPKLSVLVFSMHDERYYAERALDAGAKGYIMKNSEEADIMHAITTVLVGKVYISEREQERQSEYFINQGEVGEGEAFASIRHLTARQFQIFSLIAKGWGSLEIASRLNISIKTMDAHKENIKLKLHCRTTQELRQLAIEWSRH